MRGGVWRGVRWVRAFGARVVVPATGATPPAAMPMGEEVVAWGGTDFTLLGFIADFVRLCLFGESNMRERVEGGDTFRGVNKSVTAFGHSFSYPYRPLPPSNEE